MDNQNEEDIPKNGHKHKAFDKVSEDLFKIAFRNYINLIDIADKKAALLIQINSIIASVVIGFVAKKIEDIHMLVIPSAGILIVAGLTIFYSILASKPLGRGFLKDMHQDKQPFFFGSYDKLDPDFRYAPLEQYVAEVDELFHGDRQLLFNELIKESFQVRKVLSKKFNYLDIAYKIFFVGIVFVILTFLIVIVLMPE